MPSKIRSLSHFVEKNKLERGYLVNLTLNQVLDEKNIETIDFLWFLNRLNQF